MTIARPSELDAWRALIAPASRDDQLPARPNAIHIVHPDIAIRTQLFGIVSQVPGRMIYSYERAQPFLDHWRVRGSGVVLTAQLMSDAAGFDILEAVASSRRMQAILLVEDDSFQIAVHAHRLGAFDILARQFDALQIETLIGLAFDKVAHDAEIVDLHELARKRMARLTERERVIAQLLAGGDSNKTIGRRLDISVRTVEIHRSNIMRKLDATSLAALVRLVLLDEIVGHLHPAEG